jgi:hypothetical protein
MSSTTTPLSQHEYRKLSSTKAQTEDALMIGSQPHSIQLLNSTKNIIIYQIHNIVSVILLS